ncbi:ABC transporter substrate-binding protein [Haloarcula sp. 1CSR25-25]|uniref:ABC transporter substrate-binding protein n=1 Tax=Haloarcula sp. 1CSR25-25 TaxID=2862545 RepID=UPI00289B87F8|nr:ABC transporter substrate-binding protein [Haloarcula sp. 1CSR25-25]
MSEQTRRDLLKRLGVGSTAGVVSLAGCSQQSDDGGDGGGDGGTTATETGDESMNTESGDGESGGGEPITIGTLFPVTGTNSAYGGGHQKAANLAAEEINGAGGPLDREIETLNRDTEGNPSRAAQKFRTMINEEGIVGLVGPYSSGIGTTLAPVARDNRVMEVSNGNTSPALATAGVNEDNGVKYYGRTSPNDVQQALVMGRILNQRLEAETASFLYVDNPYGQGLAEQASENFEGETLNMVGYSQQTNDYTSTLDSVFDGDPEAVGAVMYPGNGRTILNQWSQGGYGGQWVGAEAILSPQLLSDLSDIVEGMLITSPQTANSETFISNMGGESAVTQFAPHAYDATYLEALAIQQAGEASGTAIAENIRSVSGGEGTTVGVGEFQAGKEALANDESVNYEGASGSVDLNENLEPVVPYRILEVTGGEAEVIEEVPLSYFEGKM